MNRPQTFGSPFAPRKATQRDPRALINRVASLSSLKDHGYGRILVISNRLPVNITEKEGGEWEFKMSSGGLVAGLEGVKKKLPFLWIGWPGKDFPEDRRESLSGALKEQYGCIPVYLPDDLAEDYYNGFSNGVLWPLFHYLFQEAGTNFSVKLWKQYKKANQMFADVVTNIWQPGDMIWIHDYHLLRLPTILRNNLPTAHLGLFLHIPFPSSEIFQCCPVRCSILKGFLNCDLLGFHTSDYCRHFLASCTRLLGLETSPAGLYYKGRFVATMVSPVGIDPEKFHSQLKTDKTQEFYKDFQKKFAGKKVLLGVDRLDYIKGIPHRLRSLERFFQKHPEMRDQVILVQVAVPSRTDVKEYINLKKEVDGLVGRINGQYGSLNSSPIHYLFRSVDFAELAALYAACDVAVVSSIRDGMNLVAQEYIACQSEKHGVLVLSEFAGSASSMGSGAIIVNPWNVDEMADAIYEAISLNADDRATRFRFLETFIMKHTASFWGESFIKELDRVSRAIEGLTRTPKLTSAILTPLYQKAQKRLLIFCCDGVLIPQTKVPFLAAPSRRILSTISELVKDPLNTVYLVSGRDRHTLLQHFGHLKVGIAAEYGFFITEKSNSDPGKVTWNTLDNHSDLGFLTSIKPIFQYFTDRTPGSFFEEKETSLTWHFRSTEQGFGSFRAQELQTHLDTTSSHVRVLVGDQFLEVNPHEANWTTALKRIIKLTPEFDLLLYIGDETKVSFEEYDNKRDIITCSVAKKNSQKYYLNDPVEVSNLLRAITPDAQE